MRLSACLVVALVSGLVPLTVIAATPPPTLLSPASGATVDADTSLAWAPVAHATGYRVEISQYEDFLPTTSVETVATRLEEYSIPPGTTYWRVAAIVNGDPGPWSTGSFLVEWEPPTPIGPSNGTNYASPAETPVLSWADTGADIYQVEISGPTGTWQQLAPLTSFAVDQALPAGTWSWRVRSGLGVQSSPWSDARTFTTSWPDATPTLSGPASGSTVVDPVLDWDPVPGALYYDLQIVKSLPFPATSFVTQRVTGTQWRVARATDAGIYHWRVRARQGTDNFRPVGPWSAGRSFVKQDWAVAPVGLMPTTGVWPAPPTLRWTPVPDGSRYEVQVAASPDELTSSPVRCLVDQAAASFSDDVACAVLHVPAPGPVFWRVRPIDVTWGLTGGWSAIASFSYAPPTVATPIAEPVAASPLEPAHCGDPETCGRVPEMPILTWAPVADAAFYRVQLSRGDAHLESNHWDTTDTSFLPSVLPSEFDIGAHMTWQVIACGSLTSCPTWTPAGPTLRRFIIEPRHVTLLEPAEDATVDGEFELSWTSFMPDVPPAGQPWPPVRSPGYYQLVVDDEPTFDSPHLINVGTKQTTYVVDGLPAGTIYWRVQAIAGWSATGSFTYGFSTHQTLPADGAEVPVPLTVRWAPTQGAASYRVEVDPDFVVPLAGFSEVGGTAAVMDQTLPPGTQKWRVRPVDLGGFAGSWSTRSVSIASRSSTIITPRTGMTVATIGTSFEWAVVPGARLYTFEASTDPDFGALVETVSVSGERHVPYIAYPAGPIFWRVTPRNSNGNALGEAVGAAIQAVERAPDSGGPIATAPGVAIQPGLISSAGVPLRLTWNASDMASSIGRYEVAQRVDGGAWSLVSDRATSRSLNLTLPIGHSYAFRVRGIDTAGNVGTWATSPSLALKQVGEGSRKVRYSGKWSVATSSVYLGGRAKTAKVAGAESTLTFTGRTAAFVSRVGPTRGKATILIDGSKVAVVDLYASTAKGPFIAWSTAWTAPGKHTITIRVKGTRGRPSIVVDAFMVGG